MDERALGAPAYGARDMRKRRAAGPARQDEFLQRRKIRIERFDGGFEALHVRIGDGRETRDGELAPQVEEIVLDGGQEVADRGGKIFGEQQPQRRIELVDVADRCDPRRVLGHAGSVAQSGRPGVSGLGDDA